MTTFPLEHGELDESLVSLQSGSSAPAKLIWQLFGIDSKTTTANERAFFPCNHGSKSLQQTSERARC